MSNNTIDKQYILNTGGADGIDEIFYNHAKNREFKINVWSFKEHNTNHDGIILNEDQLRKADTYLRIANNILNRHIPVTNMYVRNLLRRNYYIVKDVNVVYAICNMEDNKIEGGTAWGVAMAINLNKDVYILNLIDKLWYNYDYKIKKFVICSRPILVKNFAGIGTRKPDRTLLIFLYHEFSELFNSTGIIR